jgi:hypothetical protein
MDEVIIVSSDGHAGMPPALWSQYLDERYHHYLPALHEEAEVFGGSIEGTWPNTRDYLRKLFAGVPERDVRLMLVLASPFPPPGTGKSDAKTFNGPRRTRRSGRGSRRTRRGSRHR